MQVSSDSVPLQSRRVCLCTVKDLIPGGDVLHALLHMARHFANNATVLVHGIRGAAAQSVGYLLWQFGHLEDRRKARLHLRQPTPQLAASGALGLLPVHQKLQNRRFHVWFGHVIVDVAQRDVNV